LQNATIKCVSSPAYVCPKHDMIIPRMLVIFAVCCLVAATILARSYLRTDRGLRKGFGGLLCSALAGVGIVFSKSAVVIVPQTLIMVAGIIFLGLSMHLEVRRKNRTAD
jgi:hypothetical protein